MQNDTRPSSSGHKSVPRLLGQCVNRAKSKTYAKKNIVFGIVFCSDSTASVSMPTTLARPASGPKNHEAVLSSDAVAPHDTILAGISHVRNLHLTSFFFFTKFVEKFLAGRMKRFRPY